VDTARDPKLFALSFNRAGEPDATCADTGDRKFVAFDRAGPNLLVFLREGVIPVFALESGESRFLSILNAAKEALESFLHPLKRVAGLSANGSLLRATCELQSGGAIALCNREMRP